MVYIHSCVYAFLSLKLFNMYNTKRRRRMFYKGIMFKKLYQNPNSKPPCEVTCGEKLAQSVRATVVDSSLIV